MQVKSAFDKSNFSDGCVRVSKKLIFNGIICCGADVCSLAAVSPKRLILPGRRDKRGLPEKSRLKT
ncbi:hypothetical protein [Bergeriella denitrificans]|uniref:hypothetical protein n=1 Tax=Bergeriella denitrificans TaxID=494 RepID=UPI0012E760D4|nr:hypothetical protein [Bergeriella denitrificans]